MTYVRPVGKAYVKKGKSFGWVVLVWYGEHEFPRVFEFRDHLNWRDALDRALWYNETYYHPTTSN